MKRTSMLLKSTVIAALVAAPMAPVLAQELNVDNIGRNHLKL